MSCVAMHLHADHNNKLIDFRDENDNCDENCEVDDKVTDSGGKGRPPPQECYLHRHRSAPHGPSQSMLPGDDQH